MWQLYVVGFIVGIFTVFFDVAYQSYLPSLIDRDQLIEGNSKLQTHGRRRQHPGPGVAGVLIAAITAPYAILVDAASFVVSTAFMIPIRRRETLPEHVEGAPKPKMLPELKEGVRLRRAPPVSEVDRRLHRQLELLRQHHDGDRTAVHGARAAHVVVCRRARLRRLRDRLDRRRAVGTPRIQKAVGVGGAIWIPVMFSSLALLAWPLAPASFPVPVLLAGTFVFGFGAIAYNISQVSLRQAITPERMQGRMNASMRLIVWGTMPLGAVLGGAIATAYSSRAALWVGAIGSAVHVAAGVPLCSVRTTRRCRSR